MMYLSKTLIGLVLLAKRFSQVPHIVLVFVEIVLKKFNAKAVLLSVLLFGM